MHRWLLVLLQIVVTVGLLAFFFHDPEFRRDILETLRHANPAWLLLGVLIAGAENLVGVLRWRVFLRLLHIEVPFWKSVQICLVALFCNTFLLGAAGGDLVRAAYLIRRGADQADALLSVIMDRVCGLGALIVFTIALGAWNYAWVTSSPTSTLLFYGVLAYELVCAAFVAGSLWGASRSWTRRLPAWMPFPRFIHRLSDGYAKLAHHWDATLHALGLSLVMVPGMFGVFFCAAQAFDANIPFLKISTLMPIIDVVSSLPISVGGTGVREWAFAELLGPLTDTPAARAISISLAGFLVNVSWGFVGALLMPFHRGLVRAARSATS